MNQEIKGIFVNLVSSFNKEDIQEAYDILKRHNRKIQILIAMQFEIGDQVSFMHKEIKLTGFIQKFNSKSVAVRVMQFRPGRSELTEVNWKVSPSLLTKEE